MPGGVSIDENDTFAYKDADVTLNLRRKVILLAIIPSLLLAAVISWPRKKSNRPARCCWKSANCR
jgi:energy-converting hydrogenase Eha subunit A